MGSLLLLDFRTDPAGLILPTLGGPLFAEAFQNFSTSPARAAILGVAACSVTGLGILHGMRSFHLRSRLEGVVGKYGWDERVFQGSVSEWCGRQVGGVVCAQAGLSDKYSQLLASTEARQEFSWMPNI